MKRITLRLILVFTLSFLFLLPASTQDYKLIGLNNSSIEAPILEYYILDVFDSRELQSSIGIARSGNKDEIVMLNFFRSFHDELMDYFNLKFPANHGNIPIILNIKRFWITEYEKEGSSYSKCEIELEFLTPKKQKFYNCKERNEIPSVNNPNVIKENIIECLNKCMIHLKDPEIKNTYYTVLNSSTPPSSLAENQSIEDFSVSVSKKISTAPKGRIAIHGGYTYRFARVPESNNQEITDHYIRLKNGFHIGTDLSYFFSENNGGGITTSFSQAKSILNDVSLYDDYGHLIATGDLSENVNLYYVGPSYINRTIINNNKVNLLYNLTIGYYGYNEKFNWLGESIPITGGTIGFGVSIGVDILTSDHFAIGLQTTTLLGWLNKVRIDGELVELQESENLCRIDLTIGIRFLP